MKKISKLFILGLFIVSIFATNAFAAKSNAILAALDENGTAIEKLSDADMSAIRGTGLVQGLALPSFTAGVREYHVTYKGFGNGLDYRSFNVVGYSSTPGQGYNYGTDGAGNRLLAVGDVWLADFNSPPTSWNRPGAALAEEHFAILVETTPGSNQYAYTGYGHTNSYWNRPLTTFDW